MRVCQWAGHHLEDLKSRDLCGKTKGDTPPLSPLHREGLDYLHKTWERDGPKLLCLCDPITHPKVSNRRFRDLLMGKIIKIFSLSKAMWLFFLLSMGEMNRIFFPSLKQC